MGLHVRAVDQHVGRVGQPARRLEIGAVAEVELDAAAAARPDLGAGQGTVRVTSRTLDLGDLGTVVGYCAGARMACWSEHTRRFVDVTAFVAC